MSFPWSNFHYIKLKPVNIQVLISTFATITDTKQIVYDTLPHLISCTPSCKVSCLHQIMPSNVAAPHEPLITKGLLLKPTGPKGTSTRRVNQVITLIGDTCAHYQTTNDTLRSKDTHTPSWVLISTTLIHVTVPTLTFSQRQASQATCITIRRDNSSTIDHRKGTPPCSTSCLALILLITGLEFQHNGIARAATPQTIIKGAQPTRHAFQCYYADWFRLAMDLSGEILHLPASLYRRWLSFSSLSSP